MEFKITNKAKQRVIACLKKRGKGLGIRIKITTKGCSGMAYVLEYVDAIEAHDHKYEVDECIAIYIDPKAMQFMQGTTLDYVKHDLNEGFEFINPNEKGRCGCGESFLV
jgi:iron-sulfur cluster assembly protein